MASTRRELRSRLGRPRRLGSSGELTKPARSVAAGAHRAASCRAASASLLAGFAGALASSGGATAGSETRARGASTGRTELVSAAYRRGTVARVHVAQSKRAADRAADYDIGSFFHQEGALSTSNHQPDSAPQQGLAAGRRQVAGTTFGLRHRRMGGRPRGLRSWGLVSPGTPPCSPAIEWPQ